MTIDWGDGSPIETFTNADPEPEHFYTTDDVEYICAIMADKVIPSVTFACDEPVHEIISFGSFGITNPQFAFGAHARRW